MLARTYTKILTIHEAVLVDLDFYQDARGINAEIWTNSKASPYQWKLDSYSHSKYGVLRGAHYDDSNRKLIQCLSGTIQFALQDMREDSPTFGNSTTFLLDDRKPQQVIVPQGVANAHLCLSSSCVFYYKWSNGYKEQKVKKWNTMNVGWLIENPMLSERDK